MSNWQSCSIYILFSLLVSLLASAASDGESQQSSFDGPEGSSFAERLNFKVNYRVQSLLNGQPAALIEVRESYHSSLATGLIRHTLHRRNPLQAGRLSRDQRKIFYDTQIMRLLEYYRAEKEAPGGEQDELLRDDDFFLYENGGSNGYASGQDDNASHRQWQHHSARLVPASESLDSLMLLAGLQAPPELDLDDFMRPDCLELARSKLHYLNGLTRLLLMVECRRQDFKFTSEPAADGNKSSSPDRMTRGQPHLIYAAPKLQALANSTSRVSQMDVSVSIAKPQDQATASNTLPANRIPLSVVLNLRSNKDDILLIVNVFQFETLGAREHVSESSSDAGHSSYMLPLNQIELGHLRSAVRDKESSGLMQPLNASGQPKSQRDQCSFRATLTMSRGESGQLLSDPIEMVVLYDGRASLLASQMEFVDRSRSSGPLEGWRRDRVRTLYDGHSNTKYHLMRTNFNYNNRDELGQERDSPDDQFGWRACASDTSNNNMAELLDQSAAELFDITEAGASFMGTALVRGVLCHVFERRLFTLPKLLGLSMNDYVHLRAFTMSEIYAQIYVAASRHDERQFLARQMASDAARGKFLRLDVRLVGRLSGEMASFRLEIHSFDWSTHLLKDVPDLLDVSQACFVNNLQARHADLELALKLDRARLRDAQLDKYQAETIKTLSQDSSLLQAAVSQLLVDSLGISASQQVDLDVQLADLDLRQALGKQLEIQARLSVYEEPREQLVEQLIGYGQDLSSPLVQSLSFAPNLGARVYSYDECRWRAAHSLIPSSMSASDKDDQNEPKASSRIFMFCPQSLLCVLGDSSWKAAQTERQLTIEGLFKFPYPSDEQLPAMASDRCAFFAVELRQRELGATSWMAHGERSSGARSLLDWLEAQRLDDFRRIRDLPSELKVEQPAFGATVSLPLAASGVKLSRTFNADTELSLLTKPLLGVGYASNERPPSSLGPNPTGGHNSGAEQTVKPLQAVNLAECARNCLLLHNCNSYSACHAADGRLGCLFSSLSWSQPAEFERLRLWARTKRAAGSSAAGQNGTQLEVQLAGGATAARVQVQLRRSKLCSLHARPHSQLFKSTKGFASGTHKPASKFMLPAGSPDQCARFCQERAHLARQLVALNERSNSSALAKSQLNADRLQASRANWPADSLTKFRVFACLNFNFSPASGSCQLLPTLDHWTLLGLEHLLAAESQNGRKQLEPIAEKFKTIERWRAQLGQTNVPNWIKRDQSNFKPADHFQLDFEQLFLAQLGRRLKLDDSCELASRRKLQLKIPQTELANCASRCMHLLGCRSFDHLQSAADGGQTLCVLNAVSAADLEVAPESWPMFELASELEPAESSSRWWHYEPSELAAFMLADPHETDGPLLGRAAELLHTDRDDDRDPILIRAHDSKLLSTLFTAQTGGSE